MTVGSIEGKPESSGSHDWLRWATAVFSTTQTVCSSDAIPEESELPLLIVTASDLCSLEEVNLQALYLQPLMADVASLESRAVAAGPADERSKDVLRSQGIWYLGNDSRAATQVAVLERCLCAVQTVLAAEATALGLAAGVHAQLMYSAIAGAAGSSWSFRHQVPFMLRKGPHTASNLPSFSMALQSLHSILLAAKRVGVFLPLFALTHQIMRSSLRCAPNKVDSSIVFSSIYSDHISVEPHDRDIFGEHAPSCQDFCNESLGNFNADSCVGDIPSNGCVALQEESRGEQSEFVIDSKLQERENVGLIGLGAMGTGMAKVILRAGFSVIGYDKWQPSVDRFVEAGGIEARTPVACARGSAILVLMVVNVAQAEDILFIQGAAAALPPNAIVLLMCTVSPSQAESLAARLRTLRLDLSLIDAPVSGGTPRAASGDLTIFCSGLENAGSRQPHALVVLQTLSMTAGNKGNLINVPGGVGRGSALKLINQHLAGTHIVSTAETLVLAAKFGLPLRLFREIMLSGPAQSWMMGHRGKHMLDGLIQPPTSMISIFVKDMGIVMDEAHRRGAVIPLASLVEQMFIQGNAQGWGRDDDSSIIRLWASSGISVTCT